MSLVGGLWLYHEGFLTPKPLGGRVVLIKPVFTMTPYGNYQSSFYKFYANPVNTAWLSTQVSENWYGADEGISKFLNSTTARGWGLGDVQVMSDVAVDRGALFTLGARNFDTLILGHEEYVTQNEYDQFRQFVATGGRLIVLSGNTFQALVRYDPSSKVETYVTGHDWNFDGNSAVPSVTRPFNISNIDWLGSFPKGNDLSQSHVMINGSDPIGKVLATLPSPFSTYLEKETNILANRTLTSVAFDWGFKATVYRTITLPGGGTSIQAVSANIGAAAYTHLYKGGEVVCFSQMGEEHIMTDPNFQMFLHVALEVYIP